ncbi:hypothetical protein MC7420_979 [Coleofasciculus chthonoplastes PCC 7420]|uniref:Uncharacterized protein n=1 Tax=Coleofasciculus chthonoplastes PCC 7420 TaxID=118168 RepID=B4W0B5_9CYAN|nr:hypothetical protein MC7420_979 [Coleofasciculus chthonoplastes PCC 7420]
MLAIFPLTPNPSPTLGRGESEKITSYIFKHESFRFPFSLDGRRG